MTFAIYIRTNRFKMVRIILFIYFSSLIFHVHGQVKIHAHNDYEKAIPLYAALEARAFTIEADVYLVKGTIYVAHDFEKIDHQKTLSSMYLYPIEALFNSNNGNIASDTSYRIVLMIDIKKDGPDVLKKLIKLTKHKRKYYDRTRNAHAAQIVISGDRGPISAWNTYPDYIQFDGRPTESYDQKTLNKINLISDSYANYLMGNDKKLNVDKLQNMIEKAHGMNLPVRLWGTPDNEDGWMLMNKLGVDIINTDKVMTCREYFRKR